MTTLDIRDYDDYDTFVREWPTDTTDDDMRLRWQLMGELDADEVLVLLPEWLAEEKVGFVDGAIPTEFVGRIERETEKAILLGDATAARPLVRLAHRIHTLENGLDDATDDDRREWLAGRLDARRREFADRSEMPGLRDAWLPKSQLIHVVRRPP